MSIPEQSLFDLSGNVAIVTGSSAGLGEAMAIALATAGADIVGVSRRDNPRRVDAVVSGRNSRSFIY